MKESLAAFGVLDKAKRLILPSVEETGLAGKIEMAGYIRGMISMVAIAD